MPKGTIGTREALSCTSKAPTAHLTLLIVVGILAPSDSLFLSTIFLCF
tara:strand:+ start:1146 stop:1289 length:144 start_codon:yes stop_codon:yes gene_type:complete